MTLILDYGMGNLGSLSNALKALSFEHKVDSQIDRQATRIILPGVGAFGSAMEKLGAIKEQIHTATERELPILGVCLGQQLLFSSSEEIGQHTGLELLSGTVRYLPGGTLKVPHIGWTSLTPKSESTLMRGVEPDSQVYFVHSLYCECDPSLWAASADYGLEFPAAVEKDNIFGVQFHPEKSGEVGLRILRNFLTC